MNRYTVVEHSGLGPLALEACALRTAADERATRKAGGVVVGSYSHATALESAMVRYPNELAICPSGVAGSFSGTRLLGLRVWVPDAWAQTVVRLAEECCWSQSLDHLCEVAHGILALPAAGGAGHR